LWMYREGPDLPGLDEVRSERSVAPLPRPMPAAAPEVLDDGPGIEADSPVPTGPAAPVVLEREDESEPADDTLRAPAPGERASPAPAAPETASNGRRPESAAVPATQPARLEPAAGLRLSTLSELSGPTPAVAPALSAPSA